MNWQNLTPQQQQFLMSMLIHGQGQPQGMPQFGQAQPQGMMPGMGQPQLSNPLMAGGNSAVSPQQQMAMQQYQQMLQSPQGFGAAANGQPSLWQMLMGRSPWYGAGTAVS